MSDNPRALLGHEGKSTHIKTHDAIVAACDEVKELLLAKNKAYGDSAMSPLRVFSHANPEEQLLVRIDDKLSRIARGSEFSHEDTLLDLIGYLILLRIRRTGK